MSTNCKRTYTCPLKDSSTIYKKLCNNLLNAPKLKYKEVTNEILEEIQEFELIPRTKSCKNFKIKKSNISSYKLSYTPSMKFLKNTANNEFLSLKLTERQESTTNKPYYPVQVQTKYLKNGTSIFCNLKLTNTAQKNKQSQTNTGETKTTESITKINLE